MNKILNKMVAGISLIILLTVSGCNGAGGGASPSNPTVSMVEPVDNANNVPLYNRIVLRFNKAVNGVDASVISIHEGSKTGPQLAIASISKEDDHTYSLKTAEPHKENTKYYVVIGKGIKDSTNNFLEPLSFSYTTGIKHGLLILGTPSEAEIESGFQGVIYNVAYSYNPPSWPSSDHIVARQLLYEPPLAAAYGNGRFVVVGRHGSIVTSSDGVNWDIANSGLPNGGKDIFINGVAYGNGKFVAVGSDHAGYNNLPIVILTSSDGSHWESTLDVNTQIRPLPFLNAITYGGTGESATFVAVGLRGSVLRSKDGITWSYIDNLNNPQDFPNNSSACVGQFSSVTYGNGMFAAAYECGNTIFSNTNGGTWHIPPLQPSYWLQTNTTKLAYGNNKFITVGSYVTAVFDQNGKYLSSQFYPNELNSITFDYNLGQFIIVGESGFIITVAQPGFLASSPDGNGQSQRSIAPGNLTTVISY